MSEILQYLPVIAPAAGYAAGTAVQWASQRQLERDRQPFSEDMAEIVGEQPELSRRQRFGRAMVGSVALAGALAGGLSGAAWSKEAPNMPDAAMIEIAADYSGATNMLNADGERPVDMTRDILALFGDEETLETRVFAASAGTTTVTTPEKAITELNPFGPAPMEEAVGDAFSSIELARSEGNDAPAAIVVLSHGNRIGGVESVVDRATVETGETLPVYVINTEGDDVDPKVAAQMEEVAERTGGAYWSPEDVSVEAIEPLVDELTPDVPPTEWKFDLSSRIGMTALAVLGFAGIFRRRGQEPLSVHGDELIQIDKKEQ